MAEGNRDDIAEREKQWLKRFRHGDGRVIDELVRTYHPGMLRLARSIVGDADAEDVVQESWLRIIRGLKGFEGRARLRTWILRITANAALSRLRGSRREVRMADPDGATSETRFADDGHWRLAPASWDVDTPEALASRDDMREALLAAFERLPPAQRAAVTLRDLQGLGMEEICNILEVSLSNARVLLHRGRMRLWEAVDELQRSGN